MRCLILIIIEKKIKRAIQRLSQLNVVYMKNSEIELAA